MENISLSNSTDTFEGLELADERSYSTGRYVYRLLVRAAVLVLGVPGNCLIIRVFWTKTRKTSTHVFIMALAWADLTACLLEIHNIARDALEFTGREIHPAFLFILAFQNAVIATSVVTTGIIAADRYDCVCRSQKRFFTPRLAKACAVAALVYSVVISVPKFIDAFPGAPVSVASGVLPYALQMFSFMVVLVAIVVCYGKVYATIRRHVRSRVAAFPGPTPADDFDGLRPLHSPTAPGVAIIDNVASMIANRASASCNTRDIPSAASPRRSGAIKLHHWVPGKLDTNPSDSRTAQHARYDGFSSAKQDPPAAVIGRNPGGSTGEGPRRTRSAAVLQRKTTRMLFVTSNVFVMLWLPYWIFVTLKIAACSGGNVSETALQFLLDFQMVLLMNHAINPFLYGAANRRFRRDCREAFKKTKLC